MDYSLPGILMACFLNSLSLSSKPVLTTYFPVLKCKLHVGKGYFCLFPLYISLTPSTVPDIDYGLHIFGRIGGRTEGRKGGKKKRKQGGTIRERKGLR